MSITPEGWRLEQELQRLLRRRTDQQMRALTIAWAQAWDEISADLVAVLASLLVAGERVTAADLRRARRLQQALAVAAGRVEALTAEIAVQTTRDVRALVDAAGGAQAAIIDSQLPPAAVDLVDLRSWSRVDPRQVEAIVTRTTQRIVSQTRAITGEAARVLRRELVRGVAVGSNPRVTARRIVDRAGEGFTGGLARALTVARTETVDAYRAAARLGQTQHADVLAGWMWLASLSSRTCPACLAMHGEVFPLDEPGPEGHPQCRCGRAPVTKPWSELGFDLEEPPPIVPDADEFFAGLTPAEQQSILGKRGYQAWLAGKYPREKWAVKKSTDGWRDSWVVRKPPKLAAGGSGGRRVPPPAGPVPGAYDGPGAPKPGRVTRAVDPTTGKVVKLHEHEIIAGYRIASLGLDVHFQANPHGMLSADAVILGQVWEMKAPSGVGRHVVAGNLSKAQTQADRVILDLFRSGLSLAEQQRQIEAWLTNPRNRLAALWALPKNVREHWTWER